MHSPPKRNRPPEGTGGAVLDSDLDSNKITAADTKPNTKTQLARRLATYRVDANLVVEGCRYA